MSRTNRLTAVLMLNLALLGGLIAVGLGAHSLGLFTEGSDYLADAAGIAVALLALRFDRGARTTARAATWAALANAGWLLAANALIIAGATVRLLHDVRRVDGLPVLVISAAALMLVGALILAGGEEEVGSAGAMLDTASDAAAAAGVASPVASCSRCRAMPGSTSPSADGGAYPRQRESCAVAGTAAAGSGANALLPVSSTGQPSRS